MDIRPHTQPGRAVVCFDNEDERMAFGLASPFASAENYRRMNVMFSGLLSLGITTKSLFYDSRESAYPQEAVFTNRRLGYVAGRLSEKAGSESVSEGTNHAQHIFRMTVEYLQGQERNFAQAS